MNSDAHEKLTAIAKDAGAIRICETCWNYDIASGDGDAKNAAFALATDAWKAGQFGARPREEIMEAIDDVIRAANHTCPSCG
jgi:hypothetical protein